MIEVKDITKQYGKQKVIKKMSFTVEKGEILGFLGPNGAGKSTTMNMLTGYLAPTEGRIYINGIDLLEQPLEAKKHIGYLPEQPPLYMEMIVKDYLIFVAKLKGVAKKEREKEIQRVMSLVQIEDVSGRLIKNMSKGYKQRIGLAGALVGAPSVLILDEPTVGLDPKQIIEIRHLIKDLSQEYTVILSSHILSEISAVCDRIMIINKGEIVVSEKTEKLLHMLAGDTQLSLSIKGVGTGIEEAIRQIDGVAQILKLEEKEELTQIEMVLEKESATLKVREALFECCVAYQTPIMELKQLDISLEDIFLQVTGQANALKGEDEVC